MELDTKDKKIIGKAKNGGVPEEDAIRIYNSTEFYVAASSLRNVYGQRYMYKWPSKVGINRLSKMIICFYKTGGWR